MTEKPSPHNTEVIEANFGSREAGIPESGAEGRQNKGVETPRPNFGIIETAVDQAFAGHGERGELPDGKKVETEARKAELEAEMQGKEQKYLEKYRRKIEEIQNQLDKESDPRKIEQLKADLKKAQETYDGLKNRYELKETSAEYVRNQLMEFATRRGIDLEGQQFADQKFETDQVETIKNAVLAEAEKYFTSEQGTKNPEKHQIVQAVLAKMIDYIAQAIADGEMPPITDKHVYQLVMMMFIAVLYQDRAATENLLGDHGIRHVWGHNITMCETIADSLESHGQKVTAMDRFMMMLAMTYHDLGYAMDPVRHPTNRGGFGADAGHGLLAAKYIRETPYLAQILSPDQIRLLHEMVLTHDYTPERGFVVGNDTPRARRGNMLEAIRIADNTHAFEDKLPELLYAYPDTLLYMKLIEVAIKSGASKETIEQLKNQLLDEIKASDKFSEDDKQALANAVSIIGPSTARFTVGRICGHKPKISVNAEGRTTIEVEESQIHQLVVGIFGQQPLDQLRKFAADLTGQRKEEVDLDVDSISNGLITIKIKTKAQKLGEAQKTDYQLAVEKTITDAHFQQFLTMDNFFDSQIEDLKGQLNNTTDSAAKENIQAEIDSLKQQRLNNLGSYLKAR